MISKCSFQHKRTLQQADIKLHEQSDEKKFKPMSQQIKEAGDPEEKERLVSCEMCS